MKHFVFPCLLLLGVSVTSVYAQTQTTEGCAAVSSILAAQATDETVVLPAETAYQCLESVPTVPDDATLLLDTWTGFLEFQSDPTYKANPPPGYLFPAFDYFQSIKDLRQRVTSGNITRELDLHQGILDVLYNCNDGHLFFKSDFSSVFYFARSVALTSLSSDGQSLPKIYALSDINLSAALSYTPSAVVSIDGQDAAEFLASDYAKGTTDQDPDAIYNNQFWTQAYPNARQRTGGFANPVRYPGPSTNLTFDNGTSRSFPNSAVYGASYSFEGVVDGPTFYHQFCNATRKEIADKAQSSDTGSTKVEKTYHPKRDLTLEERDLVERQQSTLKPVVFSDDLSLRAFILSGTDELQRTGVIALSAFTSTNQTQVQTLLSQYLGVCREQGVDHLILDLQTNPGGSIIVGYDIMKQLFPDLYPYFMRQFRAHPQAEVFGEAATNVSIAILKQTGGNRSATSDYGGMSTFNAAAYIDRNGDYFPDWPSFYGPVSVHDDEFMRMFTWDVSDTVFDTAYAGDESYYAVTGYGQNVPAPPRTFQPENIVMLSNGECSSSCTSLSHFLKWQAKVPSIVLGGRPQTGPMQHPGGIKGGTVAAIESISGNAKKLYAYGDLIPKSLIAKAEKTKLVDWVPHAKYLKYRTANAATDDLISVNLVNSVLGKEAANANPEVWDGTDLIPLQYLYEAADCRMFYTEQTAFSSYSQWVSAANQAFGFNGTTPWSGCVEDSYAHNSSLLGDKKLFNDGKPVNVTDFNPANVGDGMIDASVFDTNGNQIFQMLSSSESGSATSSAGGSQETGKGDDQNAAGRFVVGEAWVVVLAVAIGMLIP